MYLRKNVYNKKHTRGKGKFDCGCGKRYNNYSAFYKHLKNYIEHKKLSGTTKVGFNYGIVKEFKCD